MTVLINRVKTAHSGATCRKADFDAAAFASSIALLLDAPRTAVVRRSGPAAAYLCTKGAADLRDVIRPLSYRFDKVFVLPTDPIAVDRWNNVASLDWRNDTASFHDELNTTELATACGVPAEWDLPAKRTVALQHARDNGFAVGLLIDDDIKFTGSEDLDRFRSMENALAGRPPRSSPDLSVLEEMFSVEAVPHAFPNGNYLFFDPTVPMGFFPKMYNDDWLFIWSSRDCRPTVLPSGSLTHGARSFDPEERAAHQEFGETLIEGLCSTQPDILDDGFWQSVIYPRRLYLKSLRALATAPSSRRTVDAAIAMHDTIDGSRLTRWCRAFLDDNRRWRERLEEKAR